MSATALLKAECNRYVNGHCSTARCVKRGLAASGLSLPMTDYAVSTCEHHEAVQEVERLRSLVSDMIENDPNDYAADAVTVLDVWRKDARDLIAATEEKD